MADQSPPQLWSENTSLYNITIEPRPVLEDISVVIPTLGRDILEQSLYWILKGSAWPAALVVVNQGAPEKVEGWLQYLRSIGVNAVHICSSQRGRSAGINRGLEQVQTRFAAITDDDCFVDENWLISLAAHLRQNPQSIVTGRVEAAGDDMLVVVTSRQPTEQRRPRIKFDSMSGGNMAAPMAVFQRIGLFDEDPCLKTAEDAELAYRALRAGVAILYRPDACLWHYGWRDPARRSEQYRGYALSHGGFYGKYLRKGDLYMLPRVAAHYFRSLRRWLRGVMSKNTDAALLGRAYFLWLLPGMLAGFRSRAQARRLP